ncbi:MAG: cyclic nucleotide-binding protein hydrogenase accessory protein HoxI [Verrucomicrobiales bacterium]|nr:cyclic nucleotide-binding protein hydrogenase accessory protein HoxI [Verrucomicrobiales bacterium]
MNDLKSIVTGQPFFKGMKREHLAVLCDCGRIAHFEPDTVLFTEGGPANEFYIVESGRVSLEVHEPGGDSAMVTTVGADGCFGWSWLYPPFVWHLSARVIEPTTVVVLNGARLLVRAEEDHDFGYELMKRVSRILMNRLQSTRSELLAKPSSEWVSA